MVGFWELYMLLMGSWSVMGGLTLLGVFVSSVNLYNISMNMIGEINM